MAGPFDSHLNRVFSKGFYRDKDFDFSVRCVLGASAHGGSDVGEVLAAIDGVPDGDHQRWFDAWLALGRRVRADADAERDAGRTVSASSSYLRAATYFAVAVNAASALKHDDPLLPTFRLQRSSWDAFVDACGQRVTRVQIPYDGTTLPGYFFRTVGHEQRPTLIMVNGSDGAISDQWSSGAGAALARGYHVLMFDGPGQQSMLFERGTRFRADWGAVLTAVVDFAVAQDGVDPDRLVGYGISQGGYWLPSALATEHRLAAAVADPGVVRVAASWESSIPASLMKLFHAGKREAFDRDMALGMRLSPTAARTWKFRARPYGQDSYYDTLAEVDRYVLSDTEAARITTPLILTAPEHEQFWPGQSEMLAERTGGRAEVVHFTAAEGADYHCQPLARRLTETRVFARLDQILT
ncbi:MULTISPECIES: alpha/beta hydrolase family protein [unclassified Gordonia (in: high G+C Gram-positive bacteria)]|uniref:alpha/beta hydrolase family protein n=1 Tax=unclassified Gordonia (in: high G+C Gram-positive bacteria) TaxID=2657482 RepID=UPI001FFFBB5C|nr:MULTISPECIES: prolyl oligopeptidase family serine peptidase [unclassified Gordonia (in: high G+C Gram-positive bacteria)]UQE76139.1 prolyl oligopeptidase family serine peptidase [Gordonia sp. PP30]